MRAVVESEWPELAQKLAPAPHVRERDHKGGCRDAMTKITDVHIDPLRPSLASRTSLPLSLRSRRQKRLGPRRLRNERYPYR
jgi:hypothetical protein